MDESPEKSPLIVLDEVDSTNTWAMRNFETLVDGTVIAAVFQSAGRGRLGRKWQTLPGTALTVSAVFKNVEKPFHAGIIIGLAGLELIREYAPAAFSFFKWPNDIYIRECKISGVLSEGVLRGGCLRGVVSGIGINVNQTSDDLAVLENPATSLSVLVGKKFFLEKLRFELAEKIKKYYIIYQSNSGTVLELWRDENRLIGENLVLNMPDGSVRQGCFTAIGADGEMCLRSSDGENFRFDCGDVKIDTSLIDFNLLENKCKLKQ